jgi:hypothetical protein
MKVPGKKLAALLICAAVLLIGGGSVLWAQHKDKNAMIPVSVVSWDQNGPKVRLLSFFVDRQVGGTTGRYCCVRVPKYWKPGLSFELYWDYTEESEGSPSPQKIRVEIEEYKPKDVENLNIHFLPNHRIKAIISGYGLGSPFYPLPKEEWVNWGVNENSLRNWKEHYYEMIKGSDRFIPTDEDWKWAEQWGLYKEEAMRRNNTPEQEQTR